MRLWEVLSNPISNDFVQVEGFLHNGNLKAGKMKKIDVGKVSINFYCKNCNGIRTFYSDKYLYCIGVNNTTVSIDCVLECPCGSSVQMWFLLECENDIFSLAPSIRILKRREKFSDSAMVNREQYGEFTESLEKAKRASRDGLGAGSIVYLRTIFETVIKQIGEAENIERTFVDRNQKEQHKSFERYLKEVDEKCHIIPREFSSDGYKLFRELSGVVHGNYNEEEALIKFDAFYRLVVGILENLKINQELMEALGVLGWNDRGDTDE